MTTLVERRDALLETIVSEHLRYSSFAPFPAWAVGRNHDVAPASLPTTAGKALRASQFSSCFRAARTDDLANLFSPGLALDTERAIP